MSKEVEISETPEPSLKDRVRNHIKKNKGTYLVAGASAAIVVLTRGMYRPTLTYAPSMNIIETVAKIRPIAILSKQNTTTNIIKVYSDRVGRPGNFCHLFGRPEIGYPSQSEAAKIFGTSNTNMSRHLNGKIPDINGYRLVRPVV